MWEERLTSILPRPFIKFNLSRSDGTSYPSPAFTSTSPRHRSHSQVPSVLLRAPRSPSILPMTDC
jgi:hypothetical protein